MIDSAFPKSVYFFKFSIPVEGSVFKDSYCYTVTTMRLVEDTETWKEVYHRESEYEGDIRSELLESLELDQVLNYENVSENDRDRVIEEEFERLASQYADENDVDPEEVNYDEVLRYIQSKEKGVALGPLSSFTTSGQILTDIKDIYEEVAEEDELTEEAELVESFYQDVPQRYNPENNDEYNEETKLDLMRLQHDIAAGGRAFAYALMDTSNVFDELTREEVVPEMISEIARKDEEREYIDNLIDQLEISIENNVENYFEQNFGETIIDIEQTIEENGDDIETLIGRVTMMEGSMTAIDEITSEINDVYNILDGHSDQLKDVTDRIGDLEDRMDEYGDKLATLEGELHEYVDAEINQLEADIDAELTSLKEDIDSNSSEIDDLEDRVSDNSTNIASNRIDVTAMMSDIEDLHSTVSALSGLEGRVDSLEGHMVSAEGTIVNNKDRLDNYDDRLLSVKASVRDIEDILGSHDDRIDNLESEKDRRKEKERGLTEIDREATEEHREQTDELGEEMNKGFTNIISDLF